jgi:hypothetical protein
VELGLGQAVAGAVQGSMQAKTGDKDLGVHSHRAAELKNNLCPGLLAGSWYTCPAPCLLQCCA